MTTIKEAVGSAAFESIPVWARTAIEDLEKQSESFERRIHLLECKVERLSERIINALF